MLYIPNNANTINFASTTLANVGATDISLKEITYPVGDDCTYPTNLIAIKFDWQDEELFHLLVPEAIKLIETIHNENPFPTEVVGMLSINSGYFPELQASIILDTLESFLSRDLADYGNWVHFQFGT